MILIMERRNFDYEGTLKYTNQYYKKLSSSRFGYEETMNDLEIIPYETLWDTILDNLKNGEETAAKPVTT